MRESEAHVYNRCTCIHILDRGDLDNTVAAMVAIPTAVGCTGSRLVQRNGTCSKRQSVRIYTTRTPVTSWKVCNLDFYIVQSVNTKIAIMTRAQRAEISAPLELYTSTTSAVLDIDCHSYNGSTNGENASKKASFGKILLTHKLYVRGFLVHQRWATPVCTTRVELISCTSRTPREPHTQKTILKLKTQRPPILKLKTQRQHSIRPPHKATQHAPYFSASTTTRVRSRWLQIPSAIIRYLINSLQRYQHRATHS